MPATLRELREQMDAKRGEVKAIYDRYGDPKDIRASDVGRVRVLTEALDELSQQYDELKGIEAARGVGDGPRPLVPNGDGRRLPGDEGYDDPLPAAKASRGPLLLKAADKLADGIPQYRGQATFGAFLKGIVTGSWDGPAGAAAKAMSVGTGSAGGFLVPEPLAARVLDLARNSAAVLRAGATTVPMTTSTLRIATVAEDAGPPVWHVENAPDVVVDDLVLGSILLESHTLPIVIKASRELFEDSENLDQVVSQSVAAALALELDRAALYGSGTGPEPLGIKNTPGVGGVSMGAAGAALDSYDPVIDAVLRIEEQNREPNAMVLAPRTNAELAKLKDSTLQPLALPPMVSGLARYVTNQIPTNLAPGTAANASDIFVGQWDQLLIGMRRSVTIELLREVFVENWQVAFACHLRADVAVADPGAFCIVAGIIAPTP